MAAPPSQCFFSRRMVWGTVTLAKAESSKSIASAPSRSPRKNPQSELKFRISLPATASLAASVCCAAAACTGTAPGSTSVQDSATASARAINIFLRIFIVILPFCIKANYSIISIIAKHLTFFYGLFLPILVDFFYFFTGNGGFRSFFYSSFDFLSPDDALKKAG